MDAGGRAPPGAVAEDEGDISPRGRLVSVGCHGLGLHIRIIEIINKISITYRSGSEPT